ncbi:MAG: lipoyl(octanoyl) transferase LipB [Nevskiales bacterium]
MGYQPYEPVWARMQAFTDLRQAETPDEFWLLEHAPVFTQGRAGKAEHLLAPGGIPVVQTDRGGQITYHGPGQLMVYTLLDMTRLGLGIRSLVIALEQALVDCLAGYGIAARGRRDAPGVYVGDAKIASLGLRVRKACSYHGLALNVNMDLAPFRRINPCGYRGLEMTQIADLGGPSDVKQVGRDLLPSLLRRLGLPELGMPELGPPERPGA